MASLSSSEEGSEDERRMRRMQNSSRIKKRRRRSRNALLWNNNNEETKKVWGDVGMMMGEMHNFYVEEKFVDVTLKGDEEEEFRAHRIILANHSAYFSRILRESPCKAPYVFLKGYQSWEIRAILEFMYTGGVRVTGGGKLRALFKVAKDLQIEGLVECIEECGFCEKSSGSLEHGGGDEKNSEKDEEVNGEVDLKIYNDENDELLNLSMTRHQEDEDDENFSKFRGIETSPLLPSPQTAEGQFLFSSQTPPQHFPRRKQARPRRRSGDFIAQDLSVGSNSYVKENEIEERGYEEEIEEEVLDYTFKNNESPPPPPNFMNFLPNNLMKNWPMHGLSSLSLSPPPLHFSKLNRMGLKHEMEVDESMHPTSGLPLGPPPIFGRHRAQHSAPRGGPPRAWSNADLTDALHNVWNKKMTTSQASRHFQIPYNSLLMYVRGKYGKSLKLDLLKKGLDQAMEKKQRQKNEKEKNGSTSSDSPHLPHSPHSNNNNNNNNNNNSLQTKKNTNNSPSPKNNGSNELNLNENSANSPSAESILGQELMLPSGFNPFSPSNLFENYPPPFPFPSPSLFSHPHSHLHPHPLMLGGHERIEPMGEKAGSSSKNSSRRLRHIKMEK